MRAGWLRHRLTLEENNPVEDAAGEETDNWTTFATVWGSVEPLRGREFFEARAETQTVDHRIRIRYLDGVTPQMRVMFRGRIFGIDSVINVLERNKELQLMCREVVSGD